MIGTTFFLPSPWSTSIIVTHSISHLVKNRIWSPTKIRTVTPFTSANPEFKEMMRGKTTCCHSKQVYDDNHSKLDYTRMIEQFCHTDRFMELECLLKFKNRFRSASLHIPSKLVAVELRFARTRWYIFPDRLIICNMGKVIFPERFEWIRFLNFSPISTSI